MYARPPAWLIASLRRSLARTHTETCVIERPTVTTGDFGERVEGFAVSATVKGRLISAGRSNSAQMAQSAEQEYLRETWRVSLPAGTALDVGYRITVNGRAYRVVGLQDNLTDALDVQALVERWRGDGT